MRPPVTDPGKKSKEGLMTALRWKVTGEIRAGRLDQGPISDEFEDLHELVYHTGTLYNGATLDEVRARAAV